MKPLIMRQNLPPECGEECPPLIFTGDGMPARCGRERGHEGIHMFRIAKNGKPWLECSWGDALAEVIGQWPTKPPGKT